MGNPEPQAISIVRSQWTDPVGRQRTTGFGRTNILSVSLLSYFIRFGEQKRTGIELISNEV